MREKLWSGWQRVRRSAMLYGAISTAVRVGANFLLLPIVLQKLSESELAMWWVFVSLGGLANLTDFGFGQAITRVYSYLWAGVEDFDVEGLRAPPPRPEPNQPRLRALHVTVRALYWTLSVVATLLLAAVGTFFLLRRESVALGPTVFWLAWALYVLAVGYNLGTAHWLLACQGTNQMRELQAANMWSGLSYVGSAALLLLADCGLFSMVAATALRSMVARTLCRRAYRAAVPPVPGERLRPERTMLKKIWPNAWKFGVLSAGVYLVTNGPILLCDRFLGESVTASYGLTAQIGLFLMTFSALWLTVKWPQITILRTQGRTTEMGVLFARRLAWAVATYAVLAVLVGLVGNRLLEWKGTPTRLLGTPWLVVYLLYMGQQLITAQFGALTFTENVVPYYRISICSGLGVVLLGLLLVPRYGLWGLILTPIVVAAACSSWYPVWRGFRGQPLGLGPFLRAALSGRT